MRVFVLNLERDEERRVAVQDRLGRLGIPHEVHVGVDATRMGRGDLEELVANGEVTSDALERMRPGAIGCALSHQRLYRRLVDEDIPAAIVLEDDVVPSPAAAEVFADVVRRIRPGELVLLYWRFAHDADFEVSSLDPEPVGEAHLWAPMRKNLRSTVAYALTREVAAGLLAANHPISQTADAWSQFWNRGAFTSIRIVHPRVVDIADVPSTVTGSRPAGDPVTAEWLADETRRRIARSPVLRPVLARRRERRLRRQLDPVFVDGASPYAPGPADPPPP